MIKISNIKYQISNIKAFCHCEVALGDRGNLMNRDYFVVPPRNDGRRSHKGFTLIELLVVIAIIGILATLVMANISGIRQRVRDGQRKTDLRQIQSVLEMYRADQATYPDHSPGTNTLSENCPPSPAPQTSFGSPDCNVIYMQKIPIDPLGAAYYNGGKYYYNYSSVTEIYTLAACLENSSDTQGTSTTDAPDEVRGVSGCASEAYFILKSP